MRPLLLFGLLSTLAAGASEGELLPRTGRLYLSSGLSVGSTRLVALGGAGVGIAEGSAAYPGNLAALAHRSPDLEEPWDVDFGLSFLDLPVGNPELLDLDNDGAVDDARSVRQLTFTLGLQFDGFALGGYSRTLVLRYCLVEPCGSHGDVRITVATTALAFAQVFGADELILAVGLYSATGQVDRAGEAWSYGSFGVTFDGLYRPADQPFRIGLSLKPQVIGPLRGPVTRIAGNLPFEALASPFTLSLGGSVRLGPGSERYNRLSPIVRRRLGKPPLPAATGPAGRWMLTAQLDVISPLEDAVAIPSLLSPERPQPLARRTALAPRVGLEHESWPGRLRTRLGSFLEPSAFPGNAPRPHLTFGFELFLFRYLEDWALSFSLDLAPRYSDLGISIGLWR